ncbi:hypothetical protein CDAR_305421 [Caerostris darwini]|uniref:Uncharacterized protein n=1 Tax=Caerostris darwini TaxID=1538125 RepID=A0AAV4MBG6_9ARAC|nr:hypothetical protein CDAR_305421 [Caerostris darwini]
MVFRLKIAEDYLKFHNLSLKFWKDIDLITDKITEFHKEERFIEEELLWMSKNVESFLMFAKDNNDVEIIPPEFLDILEIAEDIYLYFSRCRHILHDFLTAEKELFTNICIYGNTVN